jgi:serine protease Do
MGIVSAKGRELGAGPYDDFVQTDASINPGNSGGPLFNLRGQVIGINTAITPEGQGIGFAIPIDALKDIIPDLLASGTVHRGKLGVLIQPVDAALAKALGLPRSTGALISEVEPGSPAAKAGLAPGDVITKVDNAPIENAHELPRTVARHKPGTKITLEVVGKKGARTVTTVLEEAKDEEPRTGRQEPRQQQQGGGRGDLGISIAEDPRNGVVVTDVDPSGPAAGMLDAGDVILEIDGKPVKNARDAAERLRAMPPGRPALLKVEREGRTRFVALDRKGAPTE